MAQAASGGLNMGWPRKDEKEFKPNCKIRIIKPLSEVYPKYQPVVGEVYDAEYVNNKIVEGKNFRWHDHSPFCVIKILDKFIIVRKDEYEKIEE
jgi:hypothetical protein